MTDLPWLIRGSGPEYERRQIQRTGRAALDLAAAAQRIAGYLVLHRAVDISFAFEAQHLPPGTVDLRAGDPLGLAVEDPAATIVTGAGIWIGTPIAHDVRWKELEAQGRSRVLLITSALSGTYFGCQVHGLFAGRYLDGVAEQVVGIAARLVYGDGSVLVIERTTIGYRSSGVGEPRNSPDLASIIRSVPRIPEKVTSELLDAGELTAALAEAERLPPASLTINGRRWRGLR